MNSIYDKLQVLTQKLSDKNFYNSNGLGNELNFYIFDYDPEYEYVIREYLENYLNKKANLSIKIFDIYDIIIDILKEKGFLEKCFEFEQKKGIEYLNDIISKTIGIGSENDLIVKRIKKEINPNQIIILTGIGKCYGIVRGHTILNKLHSVITNNPLIMFYPGSYNGQSFKLFNKLENDNYYRAFRLGN